MSGVKGIIWGVIFLITALIMISIPTKLIFTYWVWLNDLVDLEGKPVYTLALLSVFLWMITIVVTLIFITAMCRAFVQRKSDDLGIPNGVKGFGAVTTGLVVSFMIIWYLVFQQIAFFSLVPP